MARAVLVWHAYICDYGSRRAGVACMYCGMHMCMHMHACTRQVFERVPGVDLARHAAAQPGGRLGEATACDAVRHRGTMAIE